MARLLPHQPLVLPSAPTDEERDTYFKRNAWVLAACGLAGTLGATWATAHMAISHDGMSTSCPSCSPASSA